MNFLIPDDKKPTDNDIVKAFRMCTLKAEHPGFVLCGQIVDLINRQQMKIESISRKAKAEITILLAERDVAKQEVDHLSVMVIELQNQLKTTKSEAYKEFAERLKMEAENATCVYEPDRPQADNMVYHISNIRLNKILKELIGE